MVSTDFSKLFFHLTGVEPFPWQRALYDLFVHGAIPEVANIPTGLGKTSIVSIWLIALAARPDQVSRRLVYIVNRRTVVDQTTTEVERLRNELMKPELGDVRRALASLCALPLPTLDSPPLAISTLRGKFADNGEWCIDPTRPAVVVGTVDMIGSGLLFSRYTRGFKTRPLHAGFLGQDALLVHDEAHLEHPFQTLLKEILAQQRRNKDLRKVRVIELTATSRGDGENAEAKPFGLDENPDDKDTDNDIVRKRINAFKRLILVSIEKIEGGKDKSTDGTIREEILDLALAKRNSQRAILIFVRSVKDAEKLAGDLHKARQPVATLTGTMRGKERDGLVAENPVFQRFLPGSIRAPGVTPTIGTVYLVATSAGEVGVNLSADDLLCDLSTYESMVQRFGRVNRFGDCEDSEICVVYRENLQVTYNEGLSQAQAATKDAEKKVAAYVRKNQATLRAIKTLGLLKKLEGNACPSALDALPAEERLAAFSQAPELRVATDVQFDAWALTSIRKSIAARPIVAPYLHGEADWQPPETQVAWRQELDVLTTDELRDTYPPAELLDDFPIRPHELLRDTTDRICEGIVGIVSERLKSNARLPDAWLVGDDGEVEIFKLTSLITDQAVEDDDAEEENDNREGSNATDTKKAEKTRKNRAITRLANSTLILPASLGGIDEKGILSPEAIEGHAGKVDVADTVASESTEKRLRLWSDSRDVPAGFRLIRLIDRLVADEDANDSDKGVAANRYWLWLEAKSTSSGDERRFTTSAQPETLAAHTAAVAKNAAAIAGKLLPADLGNLLVSAARLHDLGKNRAQWQRNLGNFGYDPANPQTILAKSGIGMTPRIVAEHYRHEFGSLNNAHGFPELADVEDVDRDVVLHLVAAHHGRARPHFPAEEIFDYGYSSERCENISGLATEVPRRFARLQLRFGRWGLAWLESLLRAADYAASAGTVADNDASADTSASAQQSLVINSQQEIAPAITLAINPANPGHYFACCGIFELASRLVPDTLAWFEQTSEGFSFHLACALSFDDLIGKIVSAEITTVDDADNHSAVELASPFDLRLDWWRYENRFVGKLKTWAGQMKASSIITTLQGALKLALPQNTDLQNLFSLEATPPDAVSYFDAPRSAASARDVGFSFDKLKKGGVVFQGVLHPAVELFAFVGLQRTRPSLLRCAPRAEQVYVYSLWKNPLPVALLPAAAIGDLPDCDAVQYQFANPSRTKDYRAFISANAVASR